MVDHAADLTATERAAYITRRLSLGDSLSNAEVAELCGYMDRSSAYYLMMRLARVLPITFSGGVWYMSEFAERR